MLSKAQIKHIKLLSVQKYRKQEKQFVAEGEKVVSEWLYSHAVIHYIIATAEWAAQHPHLIDRHPEATVHIVEASLLTSLSSLKAPKNVMLVVQLVAPTTLAPADEWTLVLESIQDPGNMGSIIRIADWFGISQIVSSQESVDYYNPKVIQAAMGSHLRVRLYQEDLNDFIDRSSIPVLATVLDGSSIYSLPPFPKALLMIGNEGNGLSPALIQRATNKISIPRVGGAESLNAAMATGICCSHLIPH